MAKCPGVCRYEVRYTLRRGRGKGKTRIYSYYKVRIGAPGKTVFLGNFQKKSEAIEVYKRARRNMPTLEAHANHAPG